MLPAHTLFLTDSGLETDLVFNHGIDLPCFAALTEMAHAQGRERLRGYYRRHIDIASAHGTGFIVESVTWRGGRPWAGPLAMPEATLADLNRAALALAHAIKAEAAARLVQPVLVSACMGPIGDAYQANHALDAAAAEAAHAWQAEIFAETPPDLVTALTIGNVAEAIGITRAVAATGLTVAIGFTLETDARLPDGTALADAIAAVDDASGGAPSHYLINCVHPSHFANLFATPAPWQARLKGVRANASTLSHAELDVMTVLDDGDPLALAADMQALLTAQPHWQILGGCCGTDSRHVAAMASTCARF